MNILIKKARIVDIGSALNAKTVDVLIKKGEITDIRASISDKNAKKIEIDNLHISPGWCDLHVNFRDPGYEYKEDIQSGMRAAAAGGFTAVALMPTTSPCIDSKTQVEYLIKTASTGCVDVHPVGAISINMEGEDITEMYDMKQAGAVAFSDDKKPLADAGLLERALLYSKAFKGLIMNFPYDLNIAHNGIINESENTVMLGIKAVPALAEEVMVARDISILEYTGGRLHFSTISCARSVELIREAKAKGLQISCEVAAHQLVLRDEILKTYDSNYKVMPPLRTDSDIRALITGLKDGTIDAVCSDHNPEDVENKMKEFDHAAYGIIGMETAFALLNTQLAKELKIEKIVALLSNNPRRILGLQIPHIKKGAKANITLFDPETQWTFQSKDIKSRSANTPFIGCDFKGKPLGVYNKGKLILNK